MNRLEQDEMIPWYALMDDSGQPILTVPLLSYAQVYRPEIPTGSMMTTVTVLDLADVFRPVDSVALIADIRSVYASASAIYLAGPAQERTSGSDTAQTAIHKVELRGNLPVFTASVTVEGTADGFPLSVNPMAFCDLPVLCPEILPFPCPVCRQRPDLWNFFQKRSLQYP
ncbi:MAG: beta-propeller domain-containing protein [Desulfobacterales bacterium]